MTNPELVERLAKHRMLGAVPREQLEWLANHGTIRRFEPGDVVASPEAPINSLYVVLSGHITIRVDRGGGPRTMIEWTGGDVSGLLPYSRLTKPPGTTTVDETSEVLMVPAEHFPEMIKQCYEVTAILVHVMLDRARRFTAGDYQNEKLISLGRLSAGLAHELNNPASAVARSSKELAARLIDVEATSLALGSQQLTTEQLKAIKRMRDVCEPGQQRPLSALERADREDEVAAWLAGHRLEPELAETLAESGVTLDLLEPLARDVGTEALGFALRSISASLRARRLAAEVEIASDRVHKLVAAIKGFTYMDQSKERKPVSIGQGLVDTIAMLGSKARSKSVEIAVNVEEGLPQVDGFGGELNQVWQNLIDNAIDAAPVSGRVEVNASKKNGKVLVRVKDNGPGIPVEIKDRIFEPFYTTKPQGHGTGLGLDIVQRLVMGHDGQIEFSSRPGSTEFCVTLPAA
ncbi:MAG TPA: ATP-binding protein [Candidatus Eisenbacteria bacterium]|nr:ATP-binding protein [Candidatus Eisenbacteria bacterium]